MKNVKKVLIAITLAFQDGADKYNGIKKYIKERNVPWYIHLDRQTRSLALFNNDNDFDFDFDGAIIDTAPSDERMRKFVDMPIPIVTIDWQDSAITKGKRSFVKIDSDNMEIGRTAAKAFLDTGSFASFAYLPTPVSTAWSKQRGRAFENALHAKGMAMTTILTNRPLREQLRELPKPAAVFAANDSLADRVLCECKRENISVPEDLSVLGVDNEQIICNYATPPLASIQPDFEHAGYMAAAALDALLRGESPKKHQLYHVKRLMPRRSLEPARSSGRLVQRALELINDPHSNFRNINDLARQLGVSRRLLDLRFRQIQSKSIKETIYNQQFERVCNALTSTNLPISQIAASSGIGSDTHPLRAFKKRFGMTMRCYRENARKHSSKIP